MAARKEKPEEHKPEEHKPEEHKPEPGATPPAQPPAEETEMERAMREVGVTEEMIDRPPGQRGIVDHGDRITFHCLVTRPDGRVRYSTKHWYRAKS